MSNLIKILFACGMVTACTLAPDYERPVSPVSSQWPVVSGVEHEAETSAAEIPWKVFFQSPVLQGYIAQALAYNRDLRVMALNVEKARAAYRIERSDSFPKMNVVGSEMRTGTPENANRFGGFFSGGRFTQSTYQANLAVVAWEVDLFGRVRSLNDAALEDYLADSSARDAAHISLVAEMANAYVQWLADEKSLKLAGDMLQSQQKSYAMMEKSYHQGMRSKLDYVQARSMVEFARDTQAAVVRAVAQDKNALVALMGLENADGLMVKETLDELTFLKALPVQLPATVLLHRPDIMQAEHALKAEHATIGVARAAFFPTISLTGAFGFSSIELNTLLDGGSARAWSFVPKITMPIFRGGENMANLESAEVRKQIAVANYEKAIQMAFREVSDALAARQTLATQLNAQQERVKMHQIAYDLSYARYQAGIDSYVSALQSQQELFLAQHIATDVQRLQLVNLVTLYKVLGGGLIADVNSGEDLDPPDHSAP